MQAPAVWTLLWWWRWFLWAWMWCRCRRRATVVCASPLHESPAHRATRVDRRTAQEAPDFPPVTTTWTEEATPSSRCRRRRRYRRCSWQTSVMKTRDYATLDLWTFASSTSLEASMLLRRGCRRSSVSTWAWCDQPAISQTIKNKEIWANAHETRESL